MLEKRGALHGSFVGPFHWRAILGFFRIRISRGCINIRSNFNLGGALAASIEVSSFQPPASSFQNGLV